MKVLLITAVLCSMMFCGAAAQHGQQPSDDITIDGIRVTSGMGYMSRLLGDDDRGDFWRRTFEVRMESNHRTLLNFSLRSYDYGDVNLAGLEANARIVGLGFTIPVNEMLSVRSTYNSWVEFGSNKTTDAGGLYFDWRPHNWRVEFASEMFFDQAPELYYYTGEYTLPDGWPIVSHIFSGFSRRYVQENGEPHHFEDRLALGSVVPLGSWLLNWGVSTRIDPLQWEHDSRAWSVGIALPVQYTNSDPWAPALYANYREKPGSRYLMVLGSFGGYMLNPHVVPALFRSAQRTLNIPLRVVNNQNFNIKVLNSHSQEFGRLSYTFIIFAFDVTDDLTSESLEGSLHYTHTPWKSGGLIHPFIGYTYSDSEEIMYNFMQHRLESVGHAQHIINVGGRIRLWTVDGSTGEAGYVRLSLSSYHGATGFEGVNLNVTTWF